MTDHSELICAYRLDGNGGGTQIDWDAARHWKLGEEAIWLHLDAKSENTDAWLREDSGLDSFVVDGLLVSETRPRCDWYSDGVLLILRGVNLHPGADPEDMISIRIWIGEQRIISVQLLDLMAVQDIRDQFSAGTETKWFWYPILDEL